MGWSPKAGCPRRQPELYSHTVRERAGLQLSSVVNRESYRGIKILMEENVVKPADLHPLLSLGEDKRRASRGRGQTGYNCPECADSQRGFLKTGYAQLRARSKGVMPDVMPLEASFAACLAGICSCPFPTAYRTDHETQRYE